MDPKWIILRTKTNHFRVMFISTWQCESFSSNRCTLHTIRWLISRICILQAKGIVYLRKQNDFSLKCMCLFSLLRRVNVFKSTSQLVVYLDCKASFDVEHRMQSIILQDSYILIKNDLTSTFLEFPCTTLIKIPFTSWITFFINARKWAQHNKIN